MTRLLRAANRRVGRKGFYRHWEAQIRIEELEEQMRSAVARSSPARISSKLYRIECAALKLGRLAFFANILFWCIAAVVAVADTLHHIVAT